MVEIQNQNISENIYSPEQEKQIDKFENVLERKKAYEKYPNLKWGYLDDNFFSISKNGDGEIDIFYKDGSPYFNVIEVRKDMETAGVYEAIFEKAGFEEKLEDGVHKMIDKQTGKELEPLSKEYFEAWQEIMFYETYRFINNSSYKELRKSLYDSNNLVIMGLRDFKSLRFKHSFNYYELVGRKKSSDYFIETTIQTYKTRNILTSKIIKGWITDERFEKVNDIPTRGEYKNYLDAGYIDEKLYKECMEIFDIRDKKEEEQKNINITTSKKITKIK